MQWIKPGLVSRIVIEEGLHGYEGFGSTSFPIPLALSCAMGYGPGT